MDEKELSPQPISDSEETEITIAQNNDDEAEKEIEVISERPEEQQIESEEDQPLVLVKPPILICIFVKPYKGVEVQEHSRIFYTVDTFVLDDHYVTDSFMLKVPNELPNLNEGMPISLPKHVDVSFVVGISKGEVREAPVWYLTKSCEQLGVCACTHPEEIEELLERACDESDELESGITWHKRIGGTNCNDVLEVWKTVICHAVVGGSCWNDVDVR
ncbi:hypothetical protein Scep_001394 [Stephania cephalantha]|uniref:Uncharacterized protein n=1 Tax=Stephania cephalantha TaxID=152367 RepID=A0AAP0L996_9MAGN